MMADSSAERLVGLGDSEATLRVYLANRPPLEPYETLNGLCPLATGDIADIVAKTGNHWRKIFNLYAKLVHALDARRYFRCQLSNCHVSNYQFSSWQALRENCLLQAGSGLALLFSPPSVSVEAVQIVMGKQYAEYLGVKSLYDDWQQYTPDFMISRKGRMIGCPYFDYRQLSNEKLATLVELTKSLQNTSTG